MLQKELAGLNINQILELAQLSAARFRSQSHSQHSSVPSASNFSSSHSQVRANIGSHGG